MFAIISFGAQGEVIGRRQSPSILSCCIGDDPETEILAVVVFVVNQIIEYHQTEHLFQIARIMSEKSG